MGLTLFDGQIRTLTRSTEDLRNLRYFGVTHVLTSSFDWKPFNVSQDLVSFWELLMTEERARLREAEIEPFVALGLLPEARPRRSHYEVFDRLREFSTSIDAIGEIGVSEDHGLEWELFLRQVEIAREAQLPLVVRPPEHLRITLTYKMMCELEKVGFSPDQALFLHCCEKTAKTLLEEGYNAGVAVGTFGKTPAEVADLILSLNDTSPRLIATSSIGSGAADVLCLPKLVTELQTRGMVSDDVERYLFQNAFDLFTRLH